MTKKYSYSMEQSFKKLEEAQDIAIRDNCNLTAYLKAEELKAKLCGLYSDKEEATFKDNVIEVVVREK